MELEKMRVEELREVVDRGLYYLSDMEYGRMAAFDELARRLALKNAALLLERGRAEKAEAQVKMLAEALEPFGHNDLCKIVGGQEREESPVFGRDEATLRRRDFIKAREALAKIKEEEHICACCGVSCGDRYPTDDTKSEFFCCECAA